ncbi:MAG: 2OG-Fe(II) oxygenase [Gammaproteobacteria bacterium]
MQAFTRRTHLFHGRYENLYIDAASLPGLEVILDKALTEAAAILAMPATQLKLGFWLNIMHKGDVTTLHRHDDDDELLSAVYYLQADEGAALFRLHAQGEIHAVAPHPGRFMFFDPSLPHEVTEHSLESARISIGINFGPRTQQQ